jgi:hypothetical protein
MDMATTIEMSNYIWPQGWKYHKILLIALCYYFSFQFFNFTINFSFSSKNWFSFYRGDT